MRTSRLHAALALSFLLLSPAGAAPRQDGADPAKQIEKFERYLERKPYHDWAFAQLMEAAVKANAVDKLIARYEARASEGGSKAERIVYARLIARVDRVEEALELLRAIEAPPAALWQLVGALELRRGAPAAAVEALDRAVGETTDRQELEALHRLRGEAYLAAGDSERAIGAFKDLAALAPDDFQLRLEVAGALARQGLTQAALAEFDEANRLAASDTARRCRVLSEIGRLHEQLSDGDRALAVYAEAIALMGRGNWLKRDLAERVIALHRRNKSLEALVKQAGEAAAAAPADLDAQEFHARTLRETGALSEAAEVLARATTAYPGDVALARARIDVLRAAGDTTGVIAEYQRILGAKPDELDLYLELGQAFAASGQLEQAKRQWQKTLDERLDDPGLAARLAAMYGLYGEVEDAVAMYEKAIALEPGEIVRYADLAAYLKAVGRVAAIEGALTRAEAAAHDNASKLDEVAVLWRDFDQPERARTTLERALTLAPDDVKLVQRYADVQLSAGDLDGATATLRRVVGMANDATTRRSAVDRAIQAWWRAGREDELLQRVSAGTELVDRLLHGRLLVRRRDPAGALAAYEALVVAAPEFEEAREAYAKLLEESGELETALAQYDALIELRPQNRRKYLKDIAAIHLERFDQEAAFECYDEILSSSPDNAAAFREVSKAYEQLGLVDKAIECLLQAVRLDPSDGRTRLDLAELFRATGEWDRGEREVVAAFAAKDVATRKRARETYHALLAQEGRVAAEIAALRERVSKNPYDLEAPVTLVDLYVRELEYELALDVLDDLIAYQPNEPTLMQERARVLGTLERHGEAVEVYEALWKLPDADQHALALDIADAHIKRGDRARAEEILTQLGDPDALARAYERNDLMDLAIETLQQSLQRRPNDQRLLDRLARLQERARDYPSAIASVERLLELSGESWRTLKRLGELYHTAGRRDDALAIGERLFALVRIEDVPELPQDEEGAENARNGRPARPRLTRSLSSGRGNAYDQRLDELRSWYQTIEARTEFADVAARELRRQPSNDKLLIQLSSAWSNEEDHGEELAAVLNDVRAATVEVGRTPPGTTMEQWQRTLDGMTGRLALKDAAWGRTRAEALRAELEANPDAARARELADLLLDLGDAEGALATLLAGVAAHPEDPYLRAGAASQLQRERRFSEAADHWRALLANLRANGATNELPAEEQELAFRTGRTALLRGFPIHMQRRLSDADLRRHFALTQRPLLTSSWTLGVTTPTPGGVQMALARCQHELGDDDGARETIAALALELGVTDDVERDPSTAPIGALSSLASLYASLDLDAEAQSVIERLGRIDAALDVHPLHGFNKSWSSTTRGTRRQLAKILERAGDALGAYDVLRESGSTDPAKLLLEEKSLHEEAIAFYEQRAAAAEADAARWRDEMVKLAEVYQHARRFDACLETYQAIAARDPEDFEVRDAIAKLHERALRWTDAVAEHESIVAAKREANRRAQRPTTPKRQQLTPIEIPRAEGDNSWAWDNLRNASRYGGSQTQGKFSVTEHYAAILKLLLDQRQIDRATEVMKQIAREDARNMSWLSYSFAEILGEYRLEAAGVPILRLLHSYDDSDENLNIAYGNALMAAKRFDEARRVYRGFLDKTGTQSYYREEAARQLKVAEKRLGVDSTETLADLEAKVAADPKSAKARLALAQRLFADKQDELALEHALAAEAVAPHLDEVRALVRRLLQVTGHHAELEARLLARIDDLSDEDELVSAAMQLADWMAARGELDQVEALFERVRRKAGGRFNNSSPADWYAERGDLPRAIAELERDLAKVDSWYRDQVESKIANYRRQLGDQRVVLEASWKEFDKVSAKGEKTPILRTLVAALMPLQREPETLETLARAAREAGGLRGELELAAIEMVRGDARAGEERALALARADRANAFLYPALVDLARNRDDKPQALAYLEELMALGVASESTIVYTSIGAVAEADALRAEIGFLRFELGDRAGADAIWGEMFEPDDEAGQQVLAKLYQELKLWDEALKAQREYIERSGARSASTQRALADLLYEAGEVDAALATFERLVILVEENEYERNEVVPRVMRLYREAGRLDERREQLRARLASDSDDVRGALELAQLEAEAGDVDAARALLERVAERPDQLEQTGPVLIRAARARGDLDDACRWYEKLLAGNSEEWTRRSHATEYGKILIERGEVERAVEVVLGCFPDEEGEEALSNAFNLLNEQRQYEQALAVLERTIAVAAAPDKYLQSKVNVLNALERSQEALDAVGSALSDPKQRKEWMFATYRAQDKDGTELARMTEALGAAPDDEGLQLRWCALARDKVEHYARCIELLTALSESQPNDEAVEGLLVDTLIAAKRDAEALPLLDALLERIDRERVRDESEDNWELRNTIDQLRFKRSQAALRAAGVEAAIAASLDDVGKRYEVLERWYRDNTPVSMRRWRAILSFNQDELLQAELERLTPAERRQASGIFDARLRALRYRAGEREAVRAELFARSFEAAVNPFAAPTKTTDNLAYYEDEFGNVYRSSGGRLLSASAHELIRYAHEEGLLDDLDGELAALAEQRRDDHVIEAARKEIARRRASEAGEDVASADAAERRAKAIEEAQKRVDEDAFDPARRVELARALLSDRRAAEALEHLIAAEPMIRGRAYSGLQERVVTRRDYGAAPPGVRFQFAVTSSRSGGTSYSSWSSSGGSEQEQHLRMLAAAYFASGDREAGLAAEERVARLGETSSDGWVYNPFTQSWSQGSQTLPLYIDLGLDEEVDRVAAAELEKIARECAGDSNRARQRRNQLADQLLTGFSKRAGRPVDEARRARWVEERRAGWEAHVAEAPSDLGRELRYLDWLAETAKDEAGWRARAAALVARTEWADREPSLQDGWLEFKLGDIEGARETFQGVIAARKTPWSRAVLDDAQVGLACCQAAQGDLEAARPILRWSLAESGGQGSRAVRAALGLPPLP
ncbi:MAG: tetratricopeptide repeat protein [Planctomycetota bacterium]